MRHLVYGFAVFALLLTSFLILGTCGCRKGAEEAAETPDITGKKVVMIIGTKDFRDEELFETKEVVEKAGGNVTVASSSLKEATGMLDGTCKPDMLVKDIKPEEFDAVVFVGGTGATEYWDDPEAHALAKAAAQNGKLVCAICVAPVTLANAGLLDGKKATVWRSSREKIKAKGAMYTGADVEIDGKLITAEGPKSATKFGQAIVRALGR